MGDAERVARHAAVGAMVCWLDVDNGDHRTIGAEFDIICRTGEDGKSEVGLTHKMFTVLISVSIN